MQGLLPPLVAHILFCIFRLGSLKWTHVSSPVTIFAKDRLLYLGNCFNNSFAILTPASFSSFVMRWGIHLALILLIFKSCLRIVCAAPTEIPTHLAICLVVNLASVATKFVTFSIFFAKLQFRTACMRRIFYRIYTTFKFLTPPCDRWKKKVRCSHKQYIFH